MKSVGVREFRDHASKYLDSDEILSIERHGRTLGYFIPAKGAPTVAERRERLNESLDKIEKLVNDITQRTGLTEDELADMFDIHKPLPEPLSAKAKPRTRATGS